MFATIGIALTLGGTSVALVALRRLRRLACPVCGTVGAVVPLTATVDEIPGGRPTVTCYRRCDDCGATVQAEQPNLPIGHGSRAQRLIGVGGQVRLATNHVARPRRPIPSRPR